MKSFLWLLSSAPQFFPCQFRPTEEKVVPTLPASSSSLLTEKFSDIFLPFALMVDKNDEESFLDKQQQEKRTKKWVSEKIYSPETFCNCNFVVRKCNFFWRQKDQVWDKKVSKRKKEKFQGERRKEVKQMTLSRGWLVVSRHTQFVVYFLVSFLHLIFDLIQSWLNQTSFSSHIQCNTFTPWNT